MPNIKILVAVNASFKDHWEALKAQFFPEQNILTVEGGDQRFHSVQKALAAIANDENALVAIHDSVRPLLSSALISRCFAKAASNGAVIPVMPMRASLRKKAADKTLAVNRAEYVSVQTPQVFNLKKLKAVYQQEYQESFTDDASVYESAGNEIVTVAGEATNIKVTYKEDLEIVATLLNIRD